MPKTDIIEITEQEIEEAGKDFTDLLDSISTSEDKKKMLWKQIFNNANADRHNSFLLFRELYDVVIDDSVSPSVMKSTEMAVHAKALSSYLERMAKANDQLLKLASLVAEAEEKNKALNMDDAYAAIGAPKD